MKNLMRIASGVDVIPLVLALKQNPQFWDMYKERSDNDVSVHREVSDIWVRFNDRKNFDGDLSKFNAEHDSLWYPCSEVLPVKPIVFALMARVQGERLRGVLITRIPPGKQVYPHQDHTWHSHYYQKYAVQLESAPGQSFNFEGESLEAKPGDIYWFNNAETHWVVNNSNQDRMTMIVCIK